MFKTIKSITEEVALFRDAAEKEMKYLMLDKVLGNTCIQSTGCVHITTRLWRLSGRLSVYFQRRGSQHWSAGIKNASEASNNLRSNDGPYQRVLPAEGFQLNEFTRRRR